MEAQWVDSWKPAAAWQLDLTASGAGRPKKRNSLGTRWLSAHWCHLCAQCVTCIVSFTVPKPCKPVLLTPGGHRALQNKGDFQMREDQRAITFSKSPFKSLKAILLYVLGLLNSSFLLLTKSTRFCVYISIKQPFHCWCDVKISLQRKDLLCGLSVN